MIERQIDLLPDLCDAYGDDVTFIPIPFQHYGAKATFFGQVVTLHCFHDNQLLIDTLQQDGKGKVLMVDGAGSLARALIGDQFAQLAIDNGWEGIVINGAIRDVAQLSQMPIGIKALAPCPFRADKEGQGELGVQLLLAGTTVSDGDFVYADLNGVLVSQRLLLAC
ncbi:putative 4-hydroxy-4-methyl-2-oxoglutarate aldolase [Photobacterium sp. DNB23_23_1]|uniref:4-hydroxy-4-methyl-2-oxoglutarate aldolase n=1 Tax=Photobacterium pectinilyticum TaxID=2906793 RepID=A0ABT1N885_9GAMM|nr:putative 4-hydroxy-4-methyl-2-oxoglutarate aldolase [Photobacterium sp. ZSDE20]MCQ1060931.1 putative 4-hydroxy-4-methyl-2-oxoglutarate aldolase [Photobacterium sp. ZSDE20]MDD1828848.1 putative 4-hydroxy-4-methyl-2-oxoglutarate aldolase [Photobacterium sp. ZSDE20]